VSTLLPTTAEGVSELVIARAPISRRGSKTVTEPTQFDDLLADAANSISDEEVASAQESADRVKEQDGGRKLVHRMFISAPSEGGQ